MVEIEQFSTLYETSYVIRAMDEYFLELTKNVLKLKESCQCPTLYFLISLSYLYLYGSYITFL